MLTCCLVWFYGGDQAFVVQAFLVEFREFFVGLGGDGFAFGVGLHHDVHGPLYGHARDDLLEHGDDVLHRRVVVVVQDDLVGGFLRNAALYLYTRLRLGRSYGRSRYVMQRWYALHSHLRSAELVTPGKIPRRRRIRNPYSTRYLATLQRARPRRYAGYGPLSSRRGVSPDNPR